MDLEKLKESILEELDEINDQKEIILDRLEEVNIKISERNRKAQEREYKRSV